MEIKCHNFSLFLQRKNHCCYNTITTYYINTLKMSNPIVEMFHSQIGQVLDSNFSPVGKWLSGTLREVKEGEITVDFTVRKEMTNPVGTIHGGIVSLMCDEVIGMTTFSLYNEYHYTSINLSVDFLASAKEGEALSVCAKVIRKGRTIINLTCTVTNETGKLIAKAQQNMVKTHIQLR